MNLYRAKNNAPLPTYAHRRLLIGFGLKRLATIGLEQSILQQSRAFIQIKTVYQCVSLIKYVINQKRREQKSTHLMSMGKKQISYWYYSEIQLYRLLTREVACSTGGLAVPLVALRVGCGCMMAGS